MMIPTCYFYYMNNAKAHIMGLDCALWLIPRVPPGLIRAWFVALWEEHRDGACKCSESVKCSSSRMLGLIMLLQTFSPKYAVVPCSHSFVFVRKFLPASCTGCAVNAVLANFQARLVLLKIFCEI